MRAASETRQVAKILAVLGLIAWTVPAAAQSASCPDATPVTQATVNSNPNIRNINALATSGTVTINGGAGVTFVAGNCIHLASGFRATAPTGGTPSTTFHAWVETIPSAVSASPASGSSMSQVFTLIASSPSGHSHLSELQFLLNTTLYGTDACYVRYNGASNLLYLADNSGAAWLGGFAPGSSGTAGNSYCSISGSGASVTGSGTQLSMTVPVTFKTPFAGTKNQYLLAYDNNGFHSYWQTMGTWTVPGTPTGPDFELSVAPSSWSKLTGAPAMPNYTITITPLNGFAANVDLTAAPFYGCANLGFTPNDPFVSGPTTVTVSMLCYAHAYANTYATTVTANGGGKSQEIGLSLAVEDVQRYLLTAGITPFSAGGITLSPPGPWYTAGTQVAITATPWTGFQFSSFSGADMQTGPLGWVTMNSNKIVTANFTASGTHTHTITTAPATGLSLTVDNVPCTSPCTVNWLPGSTHSISTTATQEPVSGTKYLFANWSDGGTLAHDVTAPSSPATWTANFNRQYYLTTIPGAGGTIAPASNWHNQGAVVAVSATANSGYTFTGFSGALTGSTTPQNLTMNGPATVTANFNSNSGFTLSALPQQSVSPGAGGSASAPLSVTPHGGFSQNVTFSYVNPIPGISVAFNPATVSPGGSTQVTFSAAPGTASGPYTVNLQADGGGVQQTQVVNVVVQGPSVREYIRLGDKVIAIENGSSNP